MAKLKACIVGAGRIGTGYQWLDDAATHAGAYLALKDRVELVGFVEPDHDRAYATSQKWHLTRFQLLKDAEADIVSICLQPDPALRAFYYAVCQKYGVKAMWVEKPVNSADLSVFKGATQINFMRRADPLHRQLAESKSGTRLIAYGFDNKTTKCHFEDLAKFWNVPLEYRKYDGPCSYVLETNTGGARWFDNGGVNSADCFKAMLGNLLDHLDLGTELWSPPYVE